MDILLIVGHPNADSFNHAIARTAKEELEAAGHTVHLHDLYAEGFDPVLPPEEISREGVSDPLVNRHCEELRSADGIVIVHPSWWGQPPAMVKGWVDRVFRAGVAYRFEATSSGEGIPVGLLKARKAVVFNTANSTPKQEWGALGDPLESMWDNTVLGFCGIEDFRRKLYAPVIISSDEQRRLWLADVRETVAEVFAPSTASAR
ncbi:MAG TPA: NAD(P)H-dependent oxidoreductase [Coriobacteriia bacterium]|jgi:putative NADPH-quinone reductase